MSAKISVPRASQASPEARAKAVLIDHLLDTGQVLDDAIVVPELLLGQSLRRVDLVLANGHLHAFEIKSDADNLARLDEQVCAFLKGFEAVTVVAAARLLPSVRARIPKQVGLCVLEFQGDRLTVRPVRNPVYRRMPKAAALRHLTVKDLLRARDQMPTKPVSSTRVALVRAAGNLSQPKIWELARDAIKNRHRTRFDEFLETRAKSNSLSALTAFRRSPVQIVRGKTCRCRPEDTIRSFATPDPLSICLGIRGGDGELIRVIKKARQL